MGTRCSNDISRRNDVSIPWYIMFQTINFFGFEYQDFFPESTYLKIDEIVDHRNIYYRDQDELK